MFKRLIQRIIIKNLPVEYIANAIASHEIEKNSKQLTLGNNSKLHEGAKISNLRNDRSLITIGNGTHVRGQLVLFAFGGRIQIGSNTYIGEGSRIWSAEEVVIGNNVLISHNCNIIDTDSHEIDHLERAEGYAKMVKTGHSKQKGNIVTSPIFIDDYAWISYNVSILKGVRIGKGAVIGAGSVVTKNVESFSVVAGNPAVFIKNLK